MAYVMLGLWLAWAGYWFAASFGNKPTAVQTNRTWRYGAMVLVLAIYLTRRQPWLHHHLYPRGACLRDLGTAMTAAGLAFSVWARLALGRNWSANPSIKQGHELIQTGPYRIVRHPIYTGLLLAILGSVLADGTVRSALLLAYVIVVLAVKLAIEERLMKQQFPEAYPEYKQRTKALIPYLL